MNDTVRDRTHSIKEFISENKAFILLTLLLLALANLSITAYISKERFIYNWDHVNYWSKIRNLQESFLTNKIQTVKDVIYSVREDDYNDLAAFLLMPFSFLFGTSRLSYILSIVNFYAFPAIIAFASLHGRLSRDQSYPSGLLPFISFSTIVLSPNFWYPILSGFVDVGGVLLIILILLLHFRIPYHEHRPFQIGIVAILIASLVLFRRWYAYWGAGFYGALFIVETVRCFSANQLNFKLYLRAMLKVFSQAMISVAALFLIAPTFSMRILKTNYADLYSAYQSNHSFFHALVKLVNSIGLFNFSLFVVGFLLSAFDRRLRNLSCFLMFQWIIIFVMFSRTQRFDPHQLYLLLPTIFLFSALCITNLVMRANAFRVYVMLLFVLILSMNFFYAVCPKQISDRIPDPVLFTSIRIEPLVRNDLNEIDRMIKVLDQLLDDSDDRVYVLASSQVINSSIFKNAHLINPSYRNVSRRIIQTHDVDKRDGFPNGLLKAKYVLLADPIQYHLRPEDQRVVGIPAEILLKQEGFGASFEKMPYEFELDDSVKVNIYKKVNEITKTDLEKLSEMLKMHYPDRKNIYQNVPD